MSIIVRNRKTFITSSDFRSVSLYGDFTSLIEQNPKIKFEKNQQTNNSTRYRIQKEPYHDLLVRYNDDQNGSVDFHLRVRGKNLIQFGKSLSDRYKSKIVYGSCEGFEAYIPNQQNNLDRSILIKNPENLV